MKFYVCLCRSLWMKTEEYDIRDWVTGDKDAWDLKNDKVTVNTAKNMNLIWTLTVTITVQLMMLTPNVGHYTL